MSHYITYVILPKEYQDVRKEVDSLLEPFDENTEVEEYDRDCWCVNRKAQDEVTSSLKAENYCYVADYMENILKIENPDIYNEMVILGAEYIKKTYYTIENKFSKQVDKAFKHYEMKVDKLVREHPLYNKPNPECKSCNGTGYYKSTYNPESKWDWYSIGGRYCGWVTGNIESSDDGFNFDNKYRTEDNNVGTVAFLLSTYYNAIKEKKEVPYWVFPFAIVTPDGQWWEKGKMGWWGIHTDEDLTWEQNVIKIYEGYVNNKVAGIDLHI